MLVVPDLAFNEGQFLKRQTHQAQSAGGSVVEPWSPAAVEGSKKQRTRTMDEDDYIGQFFSIQCTERLGRGKGLRLAPERSMWEHDARMYQITKWLGDGDEVKLSSVSDRRSPLPRTSDQRISNSTQERQLSDEARSSWHRDSLTQQEPLLTPTAGCSHSRHVSMQPQHGEAVPERAVPSDGRGVWQREGGAGGLEEGFGHSTGDAWLGASDLCSGVDEGASPRPVLNTADAMKFEEEVRLLNDMDGYRSLYELANSDTAFDVPQPQPSPEPLHDSETGELLDCYGISSGSPVMGAPAHMPAHERKEPYGLTTVSDMASEKTTTTRIRQSGMSWWRGADCRRYQAVMTSNIHCNW